MIPEGHKGKQVTNTLAMYIYAKVSEDTQKWG